MQQLNKPCILQRTDADIKRNSKGSPISVWRHSAWDNRNLRLTGKQQKSSRVNLIKWYIDMSQRATVFSNSNYSCDIRRPQAELWLSSHSDKTWSCQKYGHAISLGSSMRIKSPTPKVLLGTSYISEVSPFPPWNLAMKRAMGLT